MKIADFLAEQDPESFPNEAPWLTREHHDPPFTMRQLYEMEKRGVIEICTEYDKPVRYRLTSKAAQLRGNS